MALQEYNSFIIPAFITLGSAGILTPYFVEGFIIFSFILFISLVLLSKLLEKIKLKGYYDIILASISVILAFFYFGKFSIWFMAAGFGCLILAIYSIFFAVGEIKCAY